MNENLQKIIDFIQSNETLSEDDKKALLDSVKSVDEELEVTSFKLQRTEKVKKTTSILLEETIEELEQKRRIVEEQARESQIEVSLERVRAKAMAMHSSEDLALTVDLFFNELKTLNVKPRRCGVGVVNGETRVVEITSTTATEDENNVNLTGNLKLADHPVLDKIFETWQQQVEYFPILRGNEIKEYYQVMNPQIEFPNFSDDEIQYGYYFFFKEGGVFVWTDKELLEEEINIFRRFKSVLSLTYRRYIDIKEAEAQAREAQIEAALEKIRGRTMAMQKSDELAETAYVLYEQFGLLGENPEQLTIGIIDETKKIWEFWLTLGGNQINHVFKAPISEPFVLNKTYIAWKEQKKSLVIDISGDQLRAYYNFFKNLPGYKEFNDFKNNQKTEQRRVIHQAFFSNGSLSLASPEPKPAETIELLERFAGVLEQTYTRFLDLKQAEAQAREAQIEASLERVRARSMAMHHSGELSEVIAVMFGEMAQLGFELYDSNIVILDKTTKALTFWGSGLGGVELPPKFTIPFLDHPVLNEVYFTQGEGEVYREINLDGEKLKSYHEIIVTETDFKNAPEEYLKEMQSVENIYLSYAYMKHGMVEVAGSASLPKEHADILQRFAKVFEQAYTRFLDVQKAEAQAREAQIEAALERVRSKTMAMHNSDDVGITVVALFDEVLKLGLDPTIRCGIGILEGHEKMETWSATSFPDGEVDLKMGLLDMTIHPMLIGLKKAWKNHEEGYSYDYIGDDVTKYYNALNNEPDYPFHAELDALPERVYHNSFFYPEGILFAFTENPLSEEAAKVLNRFAGVFGQTYRRYLDLQKAEAQAREAQIETALERVRSKAMAMHNSNDLPATASIVFTELKKLGIRPMRSGISIQNKENRKVQIFTTTSSSEGDELSLDGWAILDHHPVLKEIYDRWLRNEDYFPELKGELLKSYYKQISPSFVFPKEQEEAEHYGYFISFTHGVFYGWSQRPIDENEKKLLKRFASVVDLTFKRYFDLQLAEANAREAQIEAALERVRTRTAAMQNSDELREVVTVIFTELQQLDIDTSMCLILIADEETGGFKWWSSGVTEEILPHSYKIPGGDELYEHPLAGWYADSRKYGVEYDTFELSGDIKRSWDKFIFENTDLKNMPQENREAMMAYEHVILCDAFMSRGSLEVSCTEPLTEDKAGILKRFAKVIDLTYTRVEDLQQAEARAVDAVRQASLDRVRAEISSMRTADDLQRITPVIWRELTTLDVPFIRCGVFMIDEANEIINVYLSTPSGESLAAMKLIFDQTPLIEHTVEYWQQRKIYKEEWNREQFIAWTKSMMKQGHIESQEKYQDGKEAPEKLVLQFMPFAQGMLYVGSTSSLSEAELDLTQKLADAFGVAYARYEDFQNLEAAHNELDQLSKELKEENDRKAEEFEEARQLQLAMLPTELPTADNFDIAVFMKTATEVGGDYYDFSTKEDGTLNVGLGDATGHGMKAGTLVTMMKSLFTGNSVNTDIEEFFVTSNKALKNSMLERMMFAFVMININRSKVTLVNAGMPPLYYYNSDKKEVQEISVHGLPLGAMKKITYECNVLTVAKDDVLLMISDGMPELHNADNEMYGYERLKKVFETNAVKSADEIINVLKDEGSNWIDDKDPEDDVSFIVVKFK